MLQRAAESALGESMPVPARWGRIAPQVLRATITVTDARIGPCSPLPKVLDKTTKKSSADRRLVPAVPGWKTTRTDADTASFHVAAFRCALGYPDHGIEGESGLSGDPDGRDREAWRQAREQGSGQLGTAPA